MANLHVRNVPAELYARIQERARAEGRSISSQVIHLLEQGLERDRRPVAEILESIRRHGLPYPEIPALPTVSSSFDRIENGERMTNHLRRGQ